MMRKKNNMRRGGGGGGRRFHSGSGGGGNRNEGQNLARQKHHATQMREKYTNMARDAQNNGDRVDVEYYLQHVDHYTRVLADITAIEAERHANQRDQQAAHSQNQEQGDDQNQGGNDDQNGGGNDGNSGDEPVSQQNQPRMTRSRHHRPAKQEPSETKHESDNNSDIPLPGSALPAI